MNDHRDAYLRRVALRNSLRHQSIESERSLSERVHLPAMFDSTAIAIRALPVTNDCPEEER